MKQLKQKREEQKKFFEYKGAELKNFYRKYAMRALIFSVAFHFAVVGAWFMSSVMNDANADKKDEIKERIIILNEVPMINEQKEVQEPVAIEKPKVTVKKDLESLTPVPTRKVDSEKLTTKSQDQLDQVKGLVSSNGDDNGSTNITDATIKIDNTKIDANIKKDPPKVEPEKNFQPFEVEKAPVPVNLSSVKSSLRYPQSAIDQGIEGKMVAKILIGKNGEVIKVGSISGPDIFKDEIREKVDDLVFTPAMMNGQTVKCWVTVPFNFKLKSGFNH